MDQGFDKVYTETREELATHLDGEKGNGSQPGGSEHEILGKVERVGYNRKRQASSGTTRNRYDAIDSTPNKRRRTEKGKLVVESHPAGCMWYYKLNLEDTQEHGPFSTEHMREWRKQGYFVGERSVKLRRDPPLETGKSTEGGGSGDAADDLFEDLHGDDNGHVEWVDSSTISF